VNLDQIPSSRRLDLWLRPTVQLSANLTLGHAELRLTELSGEYLVCQPGLTMRMVTTDHHAAMCLDRELAMNSARLAFIEAVNAQGVIQLTVHSFLGNVIELGEIVVPLIDKVRDIAVQKEHRLKAVSALADDLSERCQLDLVENRRFLFLYAGDDDGDDPAPRCFTLLGYGVRIPLALPPEGDTTTGLLPDRLIFTPSSKRTGRAVRLARGHVRFVDPGNGEGLRVMAAKTIGELLERQGSYLRRWDTYGRMEAELLMDRVRLVGALAVTGKNEATGAGIRVTLHESCPDSLRAGDSVEVVNTPPDYLFDEPVNDEAEDGDAPPPRDPIFRVLGTDRRGVTLDTGDLSAIGPGQFLVLSMLGDETQIRRRDAARQRIVDGTGANPLLGMIIEDSSDLPVARRRPAIKALTHRVRKKIFRNEPTETQLRAIHTALNTPDIAIIQGPPGTGKTTVISAIVERLNELHDRTSSLEGNILVTGYQHDAVENIIARLSVNSLPPMKFERRQRVGVSAYHEKINQWCLDLAERVREANPSVRPSAEQRILQDAMTLYLGSPSVSNAQAILGRILDLPTHLIGSDLAASAADLLGTLNDERDSRTGAASQAMATIRRLRTTAVGFADDGPLTAQMVDMDCGNRLDAESLALLRRAAEWQKPAELNFLDDLAQLKRRLLQMYAPRPVYRVEKARDDIVDLLVKVRKRLTDAQSLLADPSAAILADFLQELTINPDGAMDAIKDYNFVFAATCQQAEGRDIREAKAANKGDHVVYDTVIVDEAARVTPRDLLIPMAQGERRIILVGDHRQLLHLIDETIARRVEKEESGASSAGDFSEGSLLEISMFEYLIERLRKMEKNDGISRIVTLDAQYRMHPDLGNFVSQQFYEPFNEGYTSPLPAEIFVHNLPDTGNVAAAWLNVPADKGPPRRDGTSWTRPCEAAVIAERLAKWIKADEAKNLSFGVISFYKAQVDEVSRALERYGITERRDGGGWGIAEPYRFLPNDGRHTTPEEKLRIGTVDSFQGKEFDVVFLSMVRSGGAPRSVPPERLSTALFGHLTSVNRLCVSMSRQKRLLVVAGDAGLLAHPVAEQAVPALCAYLRLCQDKGGML